MSTIWHISFVLQASFESIYLSWQSPFFSLLNGTSKCSSSFGFLCAAMFIVAISYGTSPVKLNLLRCLNNLRPGQTIVHSIALGKLYTRALQDLSIFVEKRLFSGPEYRRD